MSLGKQIRQFRKQSGMTQTQLAERLGVSFQAVSSWENEEYMPDPDRLTELARCLGVGVNRLLEETQLPDWTLRERLSDEQHMHTQLKTALRLGNYANAYRALGHVDERCEKDLKPAGRAMHTTCHALALGIASDELLTLLLLGGYAEETGIPALDLPVPAEYREPLREFLARNTSSGSDEVRLARCIDGVYSLSTAAIGLTREETAEAVEAAEREILPQLKTLKNDRPEWNNAVYLLRYQVLALIETLKRLL